MEASLQVVKRPADIPAGRIIIMPVNLGTETATVQDPIIKYAGEINWKVVSREDALTLRKGEINAFSR